jgi:3-oxoacyl-[acyl-carrier-protein] synthase-1
MLKSRNAHVAITGLGLVTCVGHNVVTAAASVRAGITRPAPLSIEEFDDQENEPQPIIGHPLRGIADGYVGVGLYTRIASIALEDLFVSSGLSPEKIQAWQRSRVYLGLSPFRSDTFGGFSDVLAQGLGPALRRRWCWQLPNQAFVPVVSGNTACLIACQHAFDALIQGQIDRAIVVAVDSLVGEEELGFLFTQGRIKTFDQPVGLMPGEAGAALLLETEQAAKGRQAKVQAFLSRPVCASAPGKDNGEGLPDIQACSRNIFETLGAVARSGPSSLTIYTDLNGENWRANAWGSAMARSTESVDWNASKVVIPAVVLGDTGAASGGVGICLAARAYARGYAAPKVLSFGKSRAFGVVVVSLSDRGDTAAVALSPASQSARGGCR